VTRHSAPDHERVHKCICFGLHGRVIWLYLIKRIMPDGLSHTFVFARSETNVENTKIVTRCMNSLCFD